MILLGVEFSKNIRREYIDGGSPAFQLEMAASATRAKGLTLSRVVRERYSWRKIFDQLCSIYRMVIAEYQP